MGPAFVPAADYTDQDLERTLASLPIWFDMLTLGIDPSPVAAARAELETLVGGASLAEGCAHRAAQARGGELDRGELEALVDGVVALMAAAGRSLAAAGAFPSATGSVAGLFRSGGGVPKSPVAEAAIGPRGVAGDVQRTRQHHGRAWQALCLWSADVVDRLASEGHPIRPGAAGENVSIRGIDWTGVRPGARLRLGDDVLVEVSAYSLPCTKNAQWFLGGDFERMHHEREPGVSRVYASVLSGGALRPGDPVVLEP